jgi:acyl carrier protein
MGHREEGRMRDAFIARTVDWINRTLVQDGITIDADTPLFASGLINSLRVLKLIAWTERETGQRIADASIRMDNFRSVRRIAEVFCVDNGDSDVAA